MTSNRRWGPQDQPPDPAHVVRLTPPGQGAVAVVLVHGPRATELVAACFTPQSGRSLQEIPLERIALGRWVGTEGEELIVCRRTPQQVEVHPHGGEAAVENVIRLLVAQGAVECPWEQWIGREERCPLRSAARIAFCEAPTRRTATVLLDQFQGALRRDLKQAIRHLEGDASAARSILHRLSRLVEVGLHLVEPWRVVLAGRPNVGKSSLINALVGYERVIVYEQPGTTRDIVAVRTAVDGWPVELSDTAGLRESSDPLEAEGIRLAERLLARADLTIFVLDASSPLHELESQLTQALQRNRRKVVAINKADLLDASQREALGRLAGDAVPFTSARTRQGLDKLLEAIAATLVPEPPAPGEAVPFRPAHAERIKAALASLDEGDLPAALDTLKGLTSEDQPTRGIG